MRILVVGDLVTDVLVTRAGAVVPGSDTEAEIRIGGGGQAANTAAWLAHAGVAATLIAAAGDDLAGQQRVAELNAAGVDCAVRHHPGAATGSIVVLSSAGDRTMITDRGAALLLDPVDVQQAVKAAPQSVHLHLSGYPLLHAGSRPGGLAALAAARERGLTTSVDAASAGPLRAVGDFLELVRGVDVLLCNADEAEVLAGPGSAGEQAGVLRTYAKNVVVKRGAHGAVWRSSDGRLYSSAAVRVPSIDATGAGDAFAAGLLAAWLGGKGPEAALRAGAEMGAAAVRKIGARP